MNTPVSIPVIPQEPNQEVYSIQDLALFQTFTRDTYLSTFGVQAPPWDPTRLTKTWFDSTVDLSNPSNIVVYKIFSNASSSMIQMVIQAQEAATVNLTGAVVYPAYVIAATGATIGGAPLNPNLLSLESDAQALMALIGGGPLVDQGAGGLYPITYPASELRRSWGLRFSNEPVNVGLLLQSSNANGIGAPGKWDLSSGFPVWIPVPPGPTGVDDSRPPRDMPLRDLLPNEELQAGLMGVSIVRTDLAQTAAEQSGAFTPDDRATLQQIYQMVSKL